MLYKEIDSKQDEINELRNLLIKSNNTYQKELIQKDLSRVENGYKSEKNSAYYFNFYLKESSNNIILHDIRIEHNGRVAQLDHIIVNRLGIILLENKSFRGKLTINADGSLSVDYGKNIRTFPNPIEQNNRHKEVVKELIGDKMDLPFNMKLFGGIPITSKVIIDPNTSVTNTTLPEEFERADSFISNRVKEMDNISTIDVFKSIAKTITMERVKEISNFLIKNHKPIKFNYLRKYPIKQKVSEKSLNTKKKLHFCSKCKSSNIEIVYGKYGYYFKCLSCFSNSKIKLSCATDKCELRIKKNKLKFFKVCKTCKKEELFFENKS